MSLSAPAPAPTPAPFLPYGRQTISEDDIAAVVAALRSDYLTTGPLVPRFEEALCAATGARYAIAVSNGTAALHIAARAAGLGEGTVTIVPAITFLATANAVRLTGGEVAFADVDPETGSMTADTMMAAVERAGAAVRAAMPVHFAGPQAPMSSLAQIAERFGLTLIEDAAHAIGSDSAVEGRAGAGRHSAMTCFSFHPVKTMTTGEGGAVTANDPVLAERLRRDRCHGMVRDAASFQNLGLAFGPNGGANPWYYEMQEPGLNYRLTDLQCALGLSQLARLQDLVAARAALKAAYDRALEPLAPIVRTPPDPLSARPAWHLYSVRIDFAGLRRDRASVIRSLAGQGIGAQVHYIPVYRQPYYAARYGAQSLPGAERHYQETLSLPLFPGMTAEDIGRVAGALRRALGL